MERNSLLFEVIVEVSTLKRIWGTYGKLCLLRKPGIALPSGLPKNIQ